MRRLKNYERYGTIFTNKTKAQGYRDNDGTSARK